MDTVCCLGLTVTIIFGPGNGFPLVMNFVLVVVVVGVVVMRFLIP